MATQQRSSRASVALDCSSKGRAYWDRIRGSVLLHPYTRCDGRRGRSIRSNRLSRLCSVSHAWLVPIANALRDLAPQEIRALNFERKQKCLIVAHQKSQAHSTSP